MAAHQSCKTYEQSFILLNMYCLHGATSQQELGLVALLCIQGHGQTNPGEPYQCKTHMQTTLSEWFELGACPCIVTSNTLKYSLLSNFPEKPNVNQTCDTALMVALPAELRQTSLHPCEEIKISSFSSLLQPAHKSLPEFLLKLKSYSCIKEKKKEETEENTMYTDLANTSLGFCVGVRTAQPG